MPKSTDITGEIRIPQEHWGALWNFMLSHPGCEVTPNTRAKAAPKREKGTVANGSTGGCIVLRGLKGLKKPWSTLEITDLLELGGKSRSSASNVITDLVNKKLIKKTGRAQYAITQAGNKFLNTECAGA
jgi:hypothetical protein